MQAKRSHDLTLFPLGHARRRPTLRTITRTVRRDWWLALRRNECSNTDDEEKRYEAAEEIRYEIGEAGVMTYDGGLREFTCDAKCRGRKECKKEAMRAESEDREKEEYRIATQMREFRKRACNVRGGQAEVEQEGVPATWRTCRDEEAKTGENHEGGGPDDP